MDTHETDGYAMNGVPRNPGYTIPDIGPHSAHRRLRIISIGAGISGIMSTYYIQTSVQNVEHVVYEKNKDIGGTWLENKYPGCACDVPSHAYTLPFAPNVC
jgi:hydroxyversicolorone monooxygenase